MINLYFGTIIRKKRERERKRKEHKVLRKQQPTPTHKGHNETTNSLLLCNPTCPKVLSPHPTHLPIMLGVVPPISSASLDYLLGK